MFHEGRTQGFEEENRYPVLKPIPLTRVKIEGNFWGQRQAINCGATIPAIYIKFQEIGHLNALNYSRDCLKNKMSNSIIKVHPFWDSDIAKWLEGASYSIMNVQLEMPLEFGLFFRIPAWCLLLEVHLNEKNINVEKIDKGYGYFKRKWCTDNRIHLHFSIKTLQIFSHPKVHENIGLFALQRGPLVFCFEEVDNNYPLEHLFLPLENDFNLEITCDLEMIPFLKVHKKAIDLSFWENMLYCSNLQKTKAYLARAIPYFVWGNQHLGEMRV